MSNSSITDWVKEELYPALYSSVDRAFAELKFIKHSGKWQSKHYLDGQEHKTRTDKTYIAERVPGLISEHGGESLSLVDYVIKRDGVEFIQAVKTLADIAGLKLPDSRSFDAEHYKKDKSKTSLLEDCNSYFSWLLEADKEAENVREYLQGRGYSSEDINAMELGFMPTQQRLYSYLSKKGYSDELIKEAINFNESIGRAHLLSIPFRSAGRLKGFVFRLLKPIDGASKYLNSTGLKRGETFFNIKPQKGEKDLVIVEGYLDALIAERKGIQNVVALGGVNISTEQVKDAIARGAKRFTLCFDDDERGRAATLQYMEVILKESDKVYVAQLPLLDGVKADPDQVIKDQGADSFRQIIREAIPYYEHKLKALFDKYGAINKERGLTHKDIERLLEEVVEDAANIQEPIQRDLYTERFISADSIQELGITKESLTLTVERLTVSREEEAQKEALKALNLEMAAFLEKGNSKGALATLERKTKDIKALTASSLLPPVLSFSQLLDDIADIPPAYKTGYKELDEFVGFTPGAITLIAGRPSHGKTTFMFNLLIQMAGLYPDERFYFFTYEEPVKNLSVKLLNRFIGTSLSPYFRNYDLAKPTNYEFLKAYIHAERTDITEVEAGKRLFQELLDSQRITVIDRNYSVEELSSLIPMLGKKERIGAVFIDYIQRMRTERPTQDTRTKVALISDHVLQIAKDTGLPIILGAQLNRDTTGKPALENLKEAGNLEEDANTVLSVYNKSRENKADGDDSREVELEIQALKNREGEVNRRATLLFDRYTGVIK